MSELKIKFKQREDLDGVTTAFPKGSKCHYFYFLEGISFTAIKSFKRRGQIPVCVCTAKHIYRALPGFKDFSLNSTHTTKVSLGEDTH